MGKADLIAAVATAAGKGAVGVVRISGPDLVELFQPLLGRSPVARAAVLTDFLDAAGDAIDRGLAIYFPAPNSYTGDDILELQGHGGATVLNALLRRCLELGARVAEPGEFTQRAFLNGKIDLAQAESIADLIEARSEAAARSAMRSLKGEFSLRIHALVDELVALRMRVEACIDFPEEGIEHLLPDQLAERIRDLLGGVDAIRGVARQGNLLRDGARVVLAGRPNVGKSSLLNKLAGEDLAIVTELPGTTRDVLRQDLCLEGVPIQVLDTAGLRETVDPVEQLGVARARKALEGADLALVVTDATTGITDDDLRIIQELPQGLPLLVVVNKIDLAAIVPAPPNSLGLREVQISALYGQGTDALRAEILAQIGWEGAADGVFLARTRHLSAIQRASVHLETALGHVGAFELLAEELRLAQQALGEVTGAFSADDLLREIFSRFCIGK